MTSRRVRLVLLCEDNQHEVFLRRFLKGAGWHPRSMRVEKGPQGRGSGEQWVRERFPQELTDLRRRHAAAALIVMVDADVRSCEERVRGFDEACRERAIPPRSAGDRVAFIVPRRNVETWIAYLGGDLVDEAIAYPKLERPRDCAESVRQLNEMCRHGLLRDPAPASLEAACSEYQERIAPMLRRT